MRNSQLWKKKTEIDWSRSRPMEHGADQALTNMSNRYLAHERKDLVQDVANRRGPEQNDPSSVLEHSDVDHLEEYQEYMLRGIESLHVKLVCSQRRTFVVRTSD